jgi:hypothetical protein
MTPFLRRLALAAASALLLASCGDSDDPDDASAPEPADVSSETSGAAPTDDATEGTDGTPSKGTDKADTGGAVTRDKFCSGIDPQQVSDLIGVDDLAVIGDYAPGDEISGGAGAAPTVSQTWTCTIGQQSGSIGVTFNIGNFEAKPKDGGAALTNLSGVLGAENCAAVDDEALGSGTSGIDCSGTISGTGFAMAARSVVVDGTELDCQLASSGSEDIESLSRAAPEVCALFLDAVVK